MGLGAFPAAVAHATAGAGIQTPVPTHRAEVTGWEWRGLGGRCQVVGAFGWVVALGRKEGERREEEEEGHCGKRDVGQGSSTGGGRGERQDMHLWHI